jgi:hypothetical protein
MAARPAPSRCGRCRSRTSGRGGPLGRVDDLVGPEGLGQSARVGEKSAARTGPWPRPFSAAMTASPTGPHPTTRQGCPGLRPARPTACSPTASGSVSAARSVSSESGTGRRAAPGAPCARPTRPGRRWSSRSAPRPRRAHDDGHRADAGAHRQGAAVSGPCSTISAQNSCPKTQSAVGSRAGTPTGVHQAGEVTEVGQRVQVGPADAGGQRAHHDVA